MTTNESISIVLKKLATGGADADAGRNQVFDAAYAELRRIAAGLMRGERADHTLDPTAVVNEAYVRLVGDGSKDWESRAHFFGVAVRAMRQVLVHHARTKNTKKRGGDHKRISLASNVAMPDEPAVELLDLDRALTQLATKDERMARVVEMRFFAGLTADEIATVLGVSRSTVQDDWKFGKLWLSRELGGGDTSRAT